MSLVPYKEGSLILDDPSSKSLVIVHPSSGSLEFFQQIKYGDSMDSHNQWHGPARAPIASFVCPKCGTDIHPCPEPEGIDDTPDEEERNNEERGASQSLRTINGLSRNYFKLLERNHKFYALQDGSPQVLPPQHQCYIPQNLFIPGYFQKFFKTLSLLGNGARGSVYKVVHMIGDIELGVFALKKIPIGNDMIWFQKCIREVKALSSLTHRSANLITYNHVWLEMNTACGIVTTIDGEECDKIEEIPCIFILQQYCSGGNLEDFIIRDVFQKYQDHQSSEERKRRFLYRRSHPNVPLGLSTLQIASIMRDIARGLQELHDIGLIHRDLKPSNCLLLEKNTEEFSVEAYLPTIVIGDLGECQINGESRTASGATGTLEYTAPEVIITGAGFKRPTNYNEYTFASDMYSLGMICYFVVFGELPFQLQLEIADLKQKIRAFSFDEATIAKKHDESGLPPLDSRIFILMDMLLSKNADQRPSASAVVTFLDDMLSDFTNDSLPADVNINDPKLFPEESSDEKVDSQRRLSEMTEDTDLNSTNSKDISTEMTLSADNTRKWAYRLLNMLLISIILMIKRNASMPAYFAFILFGVSLNTNLSGQKLIATIFSGLITILIAKNHLLPRMIERQ